LTLVAGISFVDDIHSLPDSVRLIAQFAAAAMAFYQIGILHWSMWWIILLALIVYVGATNVINFMDGINGITIIKAIPIEPTSPAKHFALPFGRKLKIQNTNEASNIIDKPNERSSHSTIVLRGGGIIFLIGIWIWSAFFGFQYPWFLAGLTLVAGISFVDDIHSLPDSIMYVIISNYITIIIPLSYLNFSDIHLL